MTALNPSLRLTPTAVLREKSPIVKSLYDYGDVFVDETQAVALRGRWRSKLSTTAPLDVELGVGAGEFFSEYLLWKPDRGLVGIDLQFRPLERTLGRACAVGRGGYAVVRHHAHRLGEIFAPEEINDVYVLFSDPWPKRRHHKHRLIQAHFLQTLGSLQCHGGKVWFLTDHPHYFDWARDLFEVCERYDVFLQTYDFRREGEMGFPKTGFERLWSQRGLKTHAVAAKKIL